MVRIELQNVSLRREKQEILKNISFTVEDGQYLTIVGPTGSGKTSLIAAISGLYQITSGKIFFDKKDVTKLPPEERHCGFMFESYDLFPHLTIIDNVSYARHVSGKKKIETYPIAHEILNLVRIQNRDIALPKEMSGGMQQRVALARAILAMESSGLLILDEPFKALDAGLRRSLRVEVKNIAKSPQLMITTIHVTNDMNEAMMGDKILVINNGEIKQFDYPERILYSPVDLFVANFFSSQLNYFNGTVIKVLKDQKGHYRKELLNQIIIQTEEGFFLYAKTKKMFNINDEVTFLIRSHYFKTRYGRREDKTNSIVGRVKQYKFMGQWMRLEVEVEFLLDQLLINNHGQESKDELIDLKLKKYNFEDEFESQEDIYDLNRKSADIEKIQQNPTRLLKVEVPTTKIYQLNYQIGQLITLYFPSEYCIVFPRISNEELKNTLLIH